MIDRREAQVTRLKAQGSRPTAQRRVRRHAAPLALAIVTVVMVWAQPAMPRAQAPAPAPAAAQNATAGKAPTGPAPAGRANIGATMYRKVGCYQCHVNEAQGGANGPRIGPDPIPFARFVQYIRKPSGEMPPYTEKVLSAQDLADIYAFLQARQRPPALNTIPQLAP